MWTTPHLVPITLLLRLFYLLSVKGYFTLFTYVLLLLPDALAETSRITLSYNSGNEADCSVFHFNRILLCFVWIKISESSLRYIPFIILRCFSFISNLLTSLLTWKIFYILKLGLLPLKKSRWSFFSNL